MFLIWPRSIKLEDEALHFKSDIQEENTTPFSRIIEVCQSLGLFEHMPGNQTDCQFQTFQALLKNWRRYHGLVNCSR